MPGVGSRRSQPNSSSGSPEADVGSTATIAYLANASSALPKERWEVSAAGKTAICDNFRTTRILGGETVKTMNQDKGQANAVREVIDAVRAGDPSPLSLEEIVAVTRATFAINESARTGRAIEIARGLPKTTDA